MKSPLIAFLLLIHPASADPAPEPRTAAQWADELATAFTKLDGYIAAYHAERNGKTLDIVCALDSPSDRMATGLKMTKDGADMGGARWWCRGDDRLFVGDQEGSCGCITGIRTEMKWYGSLEDTIGGLATQAVDPPRLPPKYTILPSSMFQGDQISFGVKAGSLEFPAWYASAASGTVAQVAPDTITFTTEKEGDLTIDRKTGILRKQSVPAGEGPPRVLELTELTLHPGPAGVDAISANWDSEHAEPRASHALTGGFRALRMRAVIAKVEQGTASHEKLEKELAARRDGLRSIADSWIGQGKLVDNAIWKKLFDILKETARKEWLAKVPGADKLKEEVFEAYLSGRDVRRDSRELLVTTVKDSALRRKILTEIFPVPLQTENEAGEGARTLLEDAFMRAYVEALADRKFPEYWGERKGFD